MTSIILLTQLKNMGIDPNNWSKYASSISSMTFTVPIDAKNMPDFTVFYNALSKKLVKDDINDTSRS